MTRSSMPYSRGEEIANAATHGAGIVLSVTALVLLLVFSSRNGGSAHVVGTAVFGASLILLYSMSTIYHLASTPKWKKLFRTLDHSSIFLLIAGTYTPFTLVTLAGGWGWTIFGVVWALAVAGIVIETAAGLRLRKLSLGLYITMGWLIVIAAKPLAGSIAPAGLTLLLGGGLCYTFGVVFYLWKSLVYSHAIWHLFVLGGSMLHFCAVFFHVIP